MPVRVQTWLFFLTLLAVVSGVGFNVYAQSAESGIDTSAEGASAQQQAQDLEEEQNLSGTVRESFSATKPVFRPNEFNSLFFTAWEVQNIDRMRRIANENKGKTRAVTNIDAGQDFDPINKVKPPPEKREIRLAGILYNGPESWTIWLNEKRVTPDALPQEVIDLRVYKEYIEFKWIDDYTNRIYPVRLRPHQRFNMDTRIFLPG